MTSQTRPDTSSELVAIGVFSYLAMFIIGALFWSSFFKIFTFDGSTKYWLSVAMGGCAIALLFAIYMGYDDLKAKPGERFEASEKLIDMVIWGLLALAILGALVDFSVTR